MKEVQSFKYLYRGLKKSCRNVRWKPSVISYESNSLKNTYLLKKRLDAGKYKPSQYQTFQIHEPKERTIKATKIIDRQFQHSLCDNLVYECFAKSLITDTCACIVGRGVDYCLDRITHHLVQINRGGGSWWVLKCDVGHYFDSIDHDVAKAAVRKRVPDGDAVRYINQIIDSFGPVGIGLGSQLSQLIANAVLDDLDHYIKEQLRIRHYIRYMDDFVLMHENKEYLQECKNKIRIWLKDHKLRMNPKSCIYPLDQGIKMLHWHFYIKPSGKILRRMECERPAKQRQKLLSMAGKESHGELPHGTTFLTHSAWMENTRKGNTYMVRKQMHNFYNDKILEELQYDQSNTRRTDSRPGKKT